MEREQENIFVLHWNDGGKGVVISPTLRSLLCNRRGMKAHYSGYKVARHMHCQMKCIGAVCQLSMRIRRSETCGRVAILLKNCLHWGRTPFEYGKNVNSNVQSFQHHFLIYMRDFTICISLSRSHNEYISVRIHYFMIHMLDSLLKLSFIRKSL